MLFYIYFCYLTLQNIKFNKFQWYATDEHVFAIILWFNISISLNIGHKAVATLRMIAREIRMTLTLDLVDES